MIRVTRLNHTPVVLNSDLIEHIDDPRHRDQPDYRQKIMVLESSDEIIDRVVTFRRSIHA